jgi:cullin 3
MYGERTRMVLEHAIHEIYNHNASGLYFEELYRLVLQSSPPHPP